MTFEVRLTNKAERNLKRIPEPYRKKLVLFSHSLGGNSYPRGLEKLVDRDRSYRYRMGDYRVVWFIDEVDGVIHVLNIDKRPRVYG
jgi:mRNA interferase RelE/StbE